MTDNAQNPWDLLEQRIDDLVSECQSLRDENQRLRSREEILKSEKQHLTHVNLQTRTKVEAMLARLKALESKS
ncbi:MAG: TIGR02449 family protein [Pontibacterium sp.]